jgi:predicted nucleotidyltransferase
MVRIDFRYREIIKRLKRLDVVLVYLFGSYILGTHGEFSDIDIGIVLSEKCNKDYMELFGKLYSMFSEFYPGKEIDIVFLDKAPLTLKFEVVTTGKVIYRVSKEFEYNYREKIVKEYIDIKPLLEIQDKVLLERI